MKHILVSYIATLVVFVAINLVWLSAIESRLYQPAMSDMLVADFRVAPAVAFYLLFIAGLAFLTLTPGLEKGSLRRAAFHGAVVGASSYATYDLTRQSTLKKWATALNLADIAWRTLVSGTAATIGCRIALRASGCNSPVTGLAI